MFYSICGLHPRGGMGGFGFSVKLWPEFRDAVEMRGLTQHGVDTAVENMGRSWLDICGYGQLFDPDNCGFQRDKRKPPGPKARPMYKPNRDLRVTWGEWGPEHVTVPGDACGLDLSDSIPSPRGGRVLLPHNVDNWRQVHLLLVVFCWFADDLALAVEIADAEAARDAEGQ